MTVPSCPVKIKLAPSSACATASKAASSSVRHCRTLKARALAGACFFFRMINERDKVYHYLTWYQIAPTLLRR
ncbi:protein of unknown function (plasmid) [Cupriavidus taiwanensis]|uniref:Uncharacterized protein n=1 Tax=Cupriavidus taiwanensis TaxID=164546 RepID=A0A375GI21_9BURK|nr:exported hypothetical protein [Cupriavidus taiwanensis]SOZ09376.1 exported protein of unknown function [Cupriavidus taiwanensis]SOZ11502.1 exported protein of unknown function [Cupriavidus taiwanensis]SOZ42856.1 exported protein of unknown function [Cupriavidus taiwanensis]SPC19542.1 exported hypothetical protein [Cupriavidus taiwanensis]